MKLKPCPFCGCEAKAAQNFLGQYYVRCMNDHCGAAVWGDGTIHKFVTKEEVIQIWNRRTADNDK
jgi:hypothetical protein